MPYSPPLSSLGRVLRSHLQAAPASFGGQLDPRALATKLGLSEWGMQGLYDGSTRVTADLAVRLAEMFPGTSGEQWVMLQCINDLAHSRQRALRIVARMAHEMA